MSNIVKILSLHPAIRNDVFAFMHLVEIELNIELIITHGFRSFQEQEDIYQRGRSMPGRIVSNAKPGESFHNYGLAFDVAPNISLSDYKSFNNWIEIAIIGKKLGFEWGGDFKSIYDRRHFQKTFGYTHQQLLEKQLNLDKSETFVIL